MTGGVIQFEGDTYVQRSFPICGNGVIGAKGVQAMVGVLMCHIFDCKVVDDEGENCRAHFVSPEAWSVLDWMITDLVEVFGKFHVGDDPCLLQAVHSFDYLELHPPVFVH